MSRSLLVIAVVLATCAAGVAGCAPISVQEAPSISGMVVDAKTKRPIEGALLHIERYQSAPVATNSDGRFHIDAIKRVEVVFMGQNSAGDRYLIVEAPKYESSRIRVWVNAAPLNLTIPLERK